MPCWASGMSGKAAILLGGNGGENVRSEKNEHLLKPKGEWGKKLSTGLVRVRIRVNPNQGPVGGGRCPGWGSPPVTVRVTSSGR